MLITDNNIMFENRKMREQCQIFKIEHRFSSVSHPQIDDQAELINKILLNGLKKRKVGTKMGWII